MHLKFGPRRFSLVLVAATTIALWGCAGPTKTRPKLDENTAAYQHNLAAVAFKYGLEDEAVKYLEQALTLDPNHQPSLFLLASLRLDKKEYSAAEELLLKSLAFKPDDAETHTRLGMVYRQSGAQDKAEEEFLKAYALEPNPAAALNLAQHFSDRGKTEQALEYANLALGKDERSVPGLNLRGVILSRLNRNSEAAADFEKVLSLDPGNVVSAFNLAATYMSLERLKEAREILEKLMPRVTDPAMKEKIAEALEALKRTPSESR